MTRSAEIVNTSNYDGEDLEVITIGDSNVCDARVLRPGDYAHIGAYVEGSKSIVVLIPRTSKTPVPFVDEEGKRITPSLKVDLE